MKIKITPKPRSKIIDQWPPLGNFRVKETQAPKTIRITP